VPDLSFFPDPNVDRVLGAVLELAAEVYILRDRLQTIERVLEQSATLTRAGLVQYQPTEAERAERLAARDALIARILAPMTAVADSPAPPFEPV
jgi:hypothetical protein